MYGSLGHTTYDIKSIFRVTVQYNWFLKGKKTMGTHSSVKMGANSTHKTDITKRVIFILVKFRDWGFRPPKQKENNKKVCDTFKHYFRRIPINNMLDIIKGALFCIIR